MIPKKLYCRQCGKKMRKTKHELNSKTLILFTCPNSKTELSALVHDQSSFELTPKQVATWKGV